MKTISRLICGLAVVIVIVAALVVDQTHSNRANARSEVGALTEQVRSLQTRVNALEERLQKFGKAEIIPALSSPSKPPVTAPSMSTLIQSPNRFISVPGAVADTSHPPKIWGEGECNGWKYYIIPLRDPDSDNWVKVESIAR